MEDKTKIKGKNSNGEIVESYNNNGFMYLTTTISDMNIVEIISIPNTIDYLFCDNNKLTSLPQNLPENLIYLTCQKNNIKQLPYLRNYKDLMYVWCDICCFESYMLEMKNVDFTFYC